MPHPSASKLPYSYPATIAIIQLVKAARIPTRTGMVVDAVMDHPLLPPHNLLMLTLHQPAMIYIENVIAEHSEDGHIQLFIQNTSSEHQDLPSETTLGMSPFVISVQVTQRLTTTVYKQWMLQPPLMIASEGLVPHYLCQNSRSY